MQFTNLGIPVTIGAAGIANHYFRRTPLESENWRGAVRSSVALSFAFSQDSADIAMVNRIWQEGIDRSEVMKTLSYFTDVIGPRIPGSPAMKKACD